jgi:hypothetical protein
MPVCAMNDKPDEKTPKDNRKLGTNVPKPPKKEKKARKQGNLGRNQTRAWASSFKRKEGSDAKVQNTKSLQPDSSNLLTWLTGIPDIAKQLQRRKTDKTKPNHQYTERKDLKRKPLDRYTTRERTRAP